MGGLGCGGCFDGACRRGAGVVLGGGGRHSGQVVDGRAVEFVGGLRFCIAFAGEKLDEQLFRHRLLLCTTKCGVGLSGALPIAGSLSKIGSYLAEIFI